ncbi:WD40 repeat-like protein [Leucogyrophana mollusca]|uniref:WD40 repeat-like protein n=1 Tax=Leucogyrophana mollusca TaxID=85980 RepID=A0ACB8B2G2_9AGAM|nr:WD40 repeat-like protein [Leucogyrophana mollusca]
MSTSSNPIESSGVRRPSWDPTKVFKGHTTGVHSVAYFPDGRRIASAADNDKTVIIWDVKSGRQDGQPLQHDFNVVEIAISPSGRRIASGMRQGGVVVWDAVTREVVYEIKCGARRLAYSPCGRWITTARMVGWEEVQLWDADTGRPGREPLKCHDDAMCVAFSPDGSQIASGFVDGYFQVFDIATGKSVVGSIKGHADVVWSVVYSPDGRLLVTASADKSIRVWDSNTGVEVGKPMLGHGMGDAMCISISADGRRIASGGQDKTVRVWDLETRLQVGDSFGAHCWVRSVAFSPDDRYVVGGENDGAVWLWDSESLANHVIPDYRYHPDYICAYHTTHPIHPPTEAGPHQVAQRIVFNGLLPPRSSRRCAATARHSASAGRKAECRR